MLMWKKLYKGIEAKPLRQGLSKLLHEVDTDRYDKVIAPCCGRFATTEVLSNHFDNSDIYTSDILLFSSVIGKYIGGQEPQDIIDELNVELPNEWEQDYEGVDCLSNVLFAQKYYSTKHNNYYMENVRKEFLENKDVYVGKLSEKISGLKDKLGGIHYEVKDVRDVLEENRDENVFIYINPPWYKGGFPKQFDTGGMVSWNSPDIEQFDNHPEDAQGVLDDFRDSEADMVMLVNVPDIHSDLDEYDFSGWDKFFVLKRSFNMHKYLYSNFETDLSLVQRRKEDLEYDEIPIWSGSWNQEERKVEGDWLNKYSNVNFVKIDRKTAEYYRNLFLKNLKGDTSANVCGAFLVDGKMIGVVGIDPKQALKDNLGYIHETFGISPITPEMPKSICRLLMMFITSSEFKQDIKNLVNFGTSDFSGVKTVCISENRRVNLNNGLLDITDREKLPDGRWKIYYYTDFYDKSYKECIVEYLDECERRYRGLNNGG